MPNPFAHRTRVDSSEARMHQSEAPISGATLINIDGTEYVVSGATHGITLGTSTLVSGAQLVTVFLTSRSLCGLPQGFGLSHHMTIDETREIIATLERICSEAEATADTLATAAIAKARGR